MRILTLMDIVFWKPLSSSRSLKKLLELKDNILLTVFVLIQWWKRDCHMFLMSNSWCLTNWEEN